MKKLILSAVMSFALLAAMPVVAQEKKDDCCKKDKTECPKEKKECPKEKKECPEKK